MALRKHFRHIFIVSMEQFIHNTQEKANYIIEINFVRKDYLFLIMS